MITSRVNDESLFRDYSDCSHVWPQSLQRHTTIVLFSTVLQSVHSVFFEPHFGQFDMVFVTGCCGYVVYVLARIYIKNCTPEACTGRPEIRCRLRYLSPGFRTCTFRSVVRSTAFLKACGSAAILSQVL